MTDPGAELVVLEGVLFVSDGLAPICEYRGLRFGVPFRMFGPGTTIKCPGDRGTLVLTRDIAEWLEVEPRSGPN